MPNANVLSLPDDVLDAAARGWHLLPIQAKGKIPLVKDWPHAATCSLAQLETWARENPGCNWGLATGQASAVCVLDVDGEPGRVSLLGYAQQGLDLPESRVVHTGRGSHWYFRWPQGQPVRNSAGKLGPGLDIRGEGGYVLIPPSVHPSGSIYKCVNQAAPIEDAPAWLLEALKDPEQVPQTSGQTVGQGQRNGHLTSLAGSMQRRGMTQAAIEAALIVENRDRCEPPLSLSEVKAIGRSISRYAPEEHKAAIERGPDIQTLSSVEEREVEWLWPGYLPVGMLTMLSGDPGVGKTYVTLAIAADLTVGKIPYTGSPIEPCHVLYLSAENSPEHVIRPRFRMLNGDPTRFHILRGTIATDKDGKEQRGAVKLSDVSLLGKALEATGARLIIVDPIQSYLGSEVDVHRSNETRPVLDGLARLAEEYKCSILLVRHLSKGIGGKALHKGLGSIDLTAAVRVELMAGTGPDDQTQRVLLVVKINLGELASPLGFEIDSNGFRWTGRSQLTVGDILSGESTADDRNKVDDAVHFLIMTLATGPKPSKELEADASAEGISVITLRRARRKAGVNSIAPGSAGGRGGGQWLLEIPPERIREYFQARTKEAFDGMAFDSKTFLV